MNTTAIFLIRPLNKKAWIDVESPRFFICNLYHILW